MLSLCCLLLFSLVQANQQPLIKPVDTIDKTIQISFDDLPRPSQGIASIPNAYPKAESLHFFWSGFSVFQPDHPSLSNLISDYDVNCAVTSPHAILGSRYIQQGADSKDNIYAASEASLRTMGTIPYFELTPNHNQNDAAAITSFALLSLKIKPLDFPPGAETTINLRGHRLPQENGQPRTPLNFSVDFPAGYHLPLDLDLFKDFNRDKITGNEWWLLTKVEIWADYGRDEDNGYPGLDWEFCVDDIRVNPHLYEEELGL